MKKIYILLFFLMTSTFAVAQCGEGICKLSSHIIENGKVVNNINVTNNCDEDKYLYIRVFFGGDVSITVADGVLVEANTLKLITTEIRNYTFEWALIKKKKDIRKVGRRHWRKGKS